jgi:demethylmenaquinone methyltransferase / 2-methoxy-6-polyprenyl-1,4-benzoquinol methylase
LYSEFTGNIIYLKSFLLNGTFLTKELQKQSRPLHKIFSEIPPHYDIVNRIFTFGMDKKWRRQAAKECLNEKPKRILDLACGTGDLSFDITKLANYNFEIFCLDFSEPMLEIARRKFVSVFKQPTFINGDVANLPFDDNYFDCVGISFAIRNLTYKNPNSSRHLCEIARILKPGGKFVIIESSQPESRLLKILDHLFISLFVYPLGWFISGNKNAYNYLRISATNYYSAQELKTMLLQNGFNKVEFKRYFFGAAALHIAVKNSDFSPKISMI